MISLENIIKFFTLVLIVLLHLTLLINVQFTLWPEMVVYPYLMNNDFSLYTDIIMPYQPAFPVFLEFFSKIFGYQPLPYQIFTWILVVLIDLLIFLTSKNISGKISLAFCSLAFFSIISIPFGINGLWFDLVQTPLIILSCYFFYLFIENPQKRRLLLYSFLLATIAYFIKQQIIWLILWYVAIVLFRKNTRSTIKLILQMLTPFIILFAVQILLSWRRNSLEDFIYWTLYFPFLKSSSIPGYISLPNIKQIITVLALLIFFIPTILQKKIGENMLIVTGFVLLLFAYPRFDFFHLIPSLSVLSIISAQNIKTTLESKNLLLYGIVISSLIFLLAQTIRFISRNQTYEIRFFERDIYTAASFIYRITNDNDLIYVQNGPDQIFPLTGLKPAKPWADEFPWYLEIPTVQEKIVEGIKKGSPRFIIYKPYDTGAKYDLGAYKPSKIASYIEDNYENVIEITDTLWLKEKK